ncbi:MAG: DUF3365 domain-containing protein [Deltaproteobacteria bacterium]|nr:DUF3365 domain-containing protein [Deltaproteobacteria bacterium]
MVNLFDRLKYLFWGLAILWTGIITASLVWNFYAQKNKIFEIARNSAHITLEKDVIYRRWVAQHGGVYVPVSKHTPPNPYLKVPERDIFTSSGLPLTLVNPAYMIRQVNEMAANIYSQTHITSLNPIRPQNSPDPWETSALMSFEKGVQEVSSIEKVAGEEKMRVMHPFITEKPCLQCHAPQGYQEGDIRGGISVSIPIAPLRAIDKPFLAKLSLAHFLFWITGISWILLARKSFSKQILARETAEEELRKSRDELELRVQERTTELLRINETLRNLSSKLMSVQEKERKQVALEVHDVLGSSLSAIKFKSEEAMYHLPQDGPTNISKPLEELILLVRDTIEKARKIQTDLRPPHLDDLGILAALAWFCRRFQTIYPEIEVGQTIVIREEEVPDQLKIAIFRITQEAMNNIGQHAQSKSAYLSLRKVDQALELSIKDNGKGFDLESLSSGEIFKKGLGLSSMKERAELSGGSFSIESVKKKGTVIRAVWPV